jgi:haloacetate dehalogenase
MSNTALFEGFERRRVDCGGVEINLVQGGRGPALVLLHGYPQTHVMWHKVAPALARNFTVVAPDLRGHGDSGKPQSTSDHSAHCRRAMANDIATVMQALGHKRFSAAGHDRGARVVHRLARDHADRVERIAVLDIVPTEVMFANVDKTFGERWYHWFFLIQPHDFPERIIASNTDFYVRAKLGRHGVDPAIFHDDAVAEYLRCMRNPETIHATCEDYRAAASIDLEHDKADSGRKLACPVLVLWGDKGATGRTFNVLNIWRQYADNVRGAALPSGHFMPEEVPDAVAEHFLAFFGGEDSKRGAL